MLLFEASSNGETLLARAVVKKTEVYLIRIINSVLVRKYVDERACMVRKRFELDRSKEACILSFEVDTVGGARYDEQAGGDNEVRRTMLELINWLDVFDPRGNAKVPMASNHHDTYDPALVSLVCVGQR
ncbi:26S protease regulatory subunit 7 [Fasciola hepatica]|uniref:26S protease regulatory subunit 7 n=1 Tax=Fasciola hepatica TaxID=6192 RepID=A0A4E0RD96_FASHE|nr:26S protease regulatory subunit 7 [Fasciola hepatica]